MVLRFFFVIVDMGRSKWGLVGVKTTHSYFNTQLRLVRNGKCQVNRNQTVFFHWLGETVMKL